MGAISKPAKRARKKIVSVEQCREFAALVDPSEFKTHGGTVAGFADWLYSRKRSIAPDKRGYYVRAYVNAWKRRRDRRGDLDAESRKDVDGRLAADRAVAAQHKARAAWLMNFVRLGVESEITLAVIALLAIGRGAELSAPTDLFSIHRSRV